MQFYWDGTYTLALLDGPVVSALGCCSGGSRFEAPGSKTPIQSIALTLAVSYLSVQPYDYDAVHGLKKASRNRPGMRGHW